MIFVDNEQNFNPAVNLAIEEYILRQLIEYPEILLFYINEPSIIIGRHQNTIEEINQEYVKENQIHVIRRLSGGGAVYHDHGNLNYSFITHGGTENVLNFEKFTAPVITALRKMGISAELSGRNDIVVDGRKISGNAIYSSPQGLVCHGTLLFNTNLTRLGNALQVKPGKIESKGIPSVRSRVANISEFLPGPMTIETFREKILESVFEPVPDADAPETGMAQYHLTADDWAQIREIQKNRYDSWDWNYGKSPAFNVQKTRRFPFGEIDVRINVQNGKIRDIQFFGDFFSSTEPAELAALLTGTRYEKSASRSCLVGIHPEKYFGGLNQDELLNLLYE